MYQCPVCGNFSYSVVDIKAHIAKVHPDSNSDDFRRVQFDCPRCGMTFKHWMDCNNHAKRDHGMLKPECSQSTA